MRQKTFFVFILLWVSPMIVISKSTGKILPSKVQQRWANAEIGVMYHLDLQVFEPTYKFRANWNYQPDLSVFNPKELDTDQWLRAAKAAGATYAVLVAKHCSGFSLWPTKAHPYSVKNTPWRNGKGDIVKDFISSCKKYGIKPGIYASASVNAYLKVNNPGLVISGNPEEQEKYKEVVKTQLTELWSNYGKLFEVWFDGGVLPPEKGGVDIPALFKKFQPNAIAFQGPYGYRNNINYVVIQEEISKGERVREYNLYGMENGEWKFLNNGTCIGHKRIEMIKDRKLSGVRLEITKTEGNPKSKKWFAINNIFVSMFVMNPS